MQAEHGCQRGREERRAAETERGGSRGFMGMEGGLGQGAEARQGLGLGRDGELNPRIGRALEPERVERRRHREGPQATCSIRAS